MNKITRKITRYSQKIIPLMISKSQRKATSDEIHQTSTQYYKIPLRYKYFLLYVETDPWNSEWALGPAKSVKKLSSKVEKGASKWCTKLNYKSVWYQPTNTTLDSCFVLIFKDSSAVLSTNNDFTLVMFSHSGIKCNCKILNLDGSNYLFETVSSNGKLANQLLLKPNREKENTK